MNIFYLSEDVEECAKWHTDKHVVKMILESTQILCNAYYHTNQSELAPYKQTHNNHPSVIWSRESLSNWLWLRKLALALCKEYTHRYGKIHKCQGIIEGLIVPALVDKGITPMKCAMDQKYIICKDAIINYRNYYQNGKQHLWGWKNRCVPEWLSI
jgi:hypothetical protein